MRYVFRFHCVDSSYIYSPLQVELPLCHDGDFVLERLEVADVLRHGGLLEVDLYIFDSLVQLYPRLKKAKSNKAKD